MVAAQAAYHSKIYIFLFIKSIPLVFLLQFFKLFAGILTNLLNKDRLTIVENACLGSNFSKPYPQTPQNVLGLALKVLTMWPSCKKDWEP